MKQFSQTDPQWKNQLLGYDQTATIGGYGCLLTSFAMCATYYGAENVTPVSLNNDMKAVGGFQAGTAFIMGGLIGSVVSGMSVDYRKGAPLAEIDAALAQGWPVIVEIDGSPQAGLQTHYMVAYGKDSSDYLIYDPFPFPVSKGQIKLTTSAYARIAGSTSPGSIITGCFFTRGPIPATPPTPPLLDHGVHASFQVYTSADDLAVRSQPLVADFTLLKRYPVNTAFQVLEDDATANSKLGQQNQWLAIKTPDGIQGYTAAWLVAKKQTSAAPDPGTPPKPVPVPKDAPVVKTIADGLKLRTRPDNTDATILKLYPTGTELKCLEVASEVKRKVGVMFEWLQVADIEGSQGVVAAWYVSTISLGAFGPQAQREVASPSFSIMDELPPLILRTIEDGVAMRVKPFISEHTLIQRIPKGTELIPTGSQAAAAKKVGQGGKWLRVKDVKGNKGYVAAWLLKERPGDPVREASPKDC